MVMYGLVTILELFLNSRLMNEVHFQASFIRNVSNSVAFMAICCCDLQNACDYADIILR